MQVKSPRDPKTANNSTEIYIVIAIALVIVVVGTYLYNSNDPLTAHPTPEQLPLLQEPNTAGDSPVIEPNDQISIGDNDLASQDVATQTNMSAVNSSSQQQPQSIAAQLIAAKQKITGYEPEIEPTTTPEPAAVSLPSLDKSDAVVLPAAKQLSWLPLYSALLINKDLIRNFVVFVDNLSRGDLVTKFSPLQRPQEKFLVTEQAQEIYLDTLGYARYDLYVDIINSIDIEFATNQYLALKPLFKDAYQELGYPGDSFDATLYQAIEVLLDAPVIREPIKLVAPSAMYKFADPDLEQLPAAHKLMLRMGPDNQLKLQPKLLQIQLALENITRQG
ncbi:MAG: DUF3014 domain-containing protein [Gammaproteobacteria bacterium]|nr:DUF3014 domain-containing protein [Gammaproteobacteria bacterium]